VKAARAGEAAPINKTANTTALKTRITIAPRVRCKSRPEATVRESETPPLAANPSLVCLKGNASDRVRGYRKKLCPE
jgi:hypothetical protein